MSQEYLTKIQIDSSLPELGQSCILYTFDWETPSPGVQILFESATTLFEGTIDIESWKNIAENLEQDPEVFLKENKAILTGNCKTTYKFSVQGTVENLTIRWSKILGTPALSIKCGQIQLKAKPNSSAFDLLTKSTILVQELKKQVVEQSDKSSVSESECRRLIGESKKILESRVAAEEQLLDKFHALLNEKKRKIRDLEQDQF